jgi:hypothetical protein
LSRPALEPTYPPVQWIKGALFLRVKRPGREADHSPPSSAEVKNAWSCTPLPQYAFMAWCSEHRENFTLNLTSKFSLLSNGHQGLFPWTKAAGAWSWPLTPFSAKVKRWVELYLHSPNTPSWRGAQSTGTTLPLPYRVSY